jgi:pimeloyl-ACP methyl ester carboxylesterase
VPALAALAAAPMAAAVQAPPRSLDRCVHVGRETRIVRMVAGQGDRMDAAVLGRGSTGVVLANESDRNLCAWRPFARVLERHGYRVLLFDYRSGEPWVEVAAAAHELRRLGARRVFLMGASEGAKASIVAAAKHTRTSGVVSLSAERYVIGVDVEPWAAKLRQPILFVTAQADPDSENDTPALYQACGSSDKALLTLPGAAHGVALFHRRTSSLLRRRILGFLRVHA